MQKFCGQCGSVLKPNEKFCTSCGAAVSNERPKQKINSKILIIVLSVVALVGVGILAGIQFKSVPETQDKNLTLKKNISENKNSAPPLDSSQNKGAEIVSVVNSNDVFITDYGMFRYFAIYDSYISHGENGAELDVKVVEENDNGSQNLIDTVHYSFNQTNDSRGFRYYTSFGESGWAVENNLANSVLNFIVYNYYHGE